jgi:hypothetical protein
MAAHFMLLGYWTAACLGLLAATRFCVSLFSTSKWLMAVFVTATLIIAVLTFKGILTVLACTGGIFGSVAAFCKNDRRLRELMFCGTSIWTIHNVLAESPAAVFLELLFIASNVVGYFRYYILPDKRQMRKK